MTAALIVVISMSMQQYVTADIGSIHTKYSSLIVLISEFLARLVYRARQYMSPVMHKEANKRYEEGLKAAL